MKKIPRFTMMPSLFDNAMDSELESYLRPSIQPGNSKVEKLTIEDEDDIAILMNAGKMRNIEELTLESWNKWDGDLVIGNAPNLNYIEVKEDTLKNLQSLKICNNEKLGTIDIDSLAFYDVKIVIIESIAEMIT